MLLPIEGMLLAVLPSLLLIASAARAAYPPELVWSDCGSNEKCGDLEFCQDGSSYGYRAVGDTSVECGSKPGPLIRVERGTVYRLVLHNVASVGTNLHTHGLHVVGDGDGDDVTRIAEGGNTCLSYTWDIAADHPGGTYWYHPHLHGRSNEQVAGGAFGMLVVEDDADEVNEWARPDNELFLLVFSQGKDGGWGGRESDDNRWDDRGRRRRLAPLANGAGRETFRVLPDHWYRLRMSVVVPQADPDVISFGGGCTVYKVASDGVWHSAGLTSYEGSSFALTGASRADFAVRCGTGSSDISWGGSVVAVVDANSEHDVSTAGGVAWSGDDAWDLGEAPPRPPSLEDLSSVSVAGSNRFTLVLERDSIRFNGSTHSGMSGLGDINFDQVYEMQLGDSGKHPFHLHLYHMQIVTPGGCGDHVEGEHYDTISAPRGESCTVRFRTADFGQKMVMHCHKLEHEDDGAIDFLNVVGVSESRRNTVDSPSFACPAAGGTSAHEYAASREEEACNMSFCEEDSDCCGGSCRQYGRCHDAFVANDASRPSTVRGSQSIGHCFFFFAICIGFLT